MNAVSGSNARGVGARLTFLNFLLVGATIAIFIVAVVFSISNTIEDRANKEVKDKTNLLVSLIRATDADLRTRASGLAKVFQSNLAGTFELGTDTLDINGKDSPVIRLDGKPLNLDFTVVDRFTESTGAVATVFAKTGDDFMRVTTSLKNDKGARAVGTLLDRAHPGYKAVLEGGTFTGLASLFGRQYMTH